MSFDDLKRVYVDRTLSMAKTGEALGVPKTNVEYWLKRHGIPRRPLRRYARRAFDGPKFEKAYLIGFRFGDLAVRREGLGILVSTTTTHPAMLVLFLTAFEKYGHVSFTPAYNKQYSEYQWSARVALDMSFSFLLAKGRGVPKWISGDEQYLMWFIAGFVDAEGTIGMVFPTIAGRYRVVRPYLSLSNTNLSLLSDIVRLTQSYHSRIVLTRKKGSPTSRNGRIRRMNQWSIVIVQRAALKAALSNLPLRHLEKVAKTGLALEALEGCGWDDMKTRYLNLRTEIKDGVFELATTAASNLGRRPA